MKKKTLLKYELDEEEAAAHLAKKAKKERDRIQNLNWDNLTKLSQVMYQDKIKALGTTHAYCLSAPLALLAFLNPLTIVTIPPHSTKVDLERLTGMTIGDLEILMRERIVQAVIFSPTKYEGLEYLDPILKLKPPCYVNRSGPLYSVISNGQFEEYQNNAMQIPFIKASPELRSLQEPYQRVNPFLSDADIMRSNAYRYAAMSCIVGKERTEEMFESRSINYVEKLKRLLDFHIHFDHPLTHGLGGKPFINRFEYIDLSKDGLNIIHQAVQNIVVEEIHIRIPINPTLSDIIQSHSQGIPRNLEKLCLEFSCNEIEDVSGKVKETIEKINYEISKVELTAKKLSVSFTVGILVSSVIGGILMEQFGTSLAIPGLSPLVRGFMERLIQKIILMRKSPDLVYYWNLRRVTRKK